MRYQLAKGKVVKYPYSRQTCCSSKHTLTQRGYAGHEVFIKFCEVITRVVRAKTGRSGYSPEIHSRVGGVHCWASPHVQSWSVQRPRGHSLCSRSMEGSGTGHSLSPNRRRSTCSSVADGGNQRGPWVAGTGTRTRSARTHLQTCLPSWRPLLVQLHQPSS